MPKPPAKRKASGPLAHIPTIDANLYANVGRYAGSAVMMAFEQIGGVQRLSEWADENPTDFYKGVFGKVISAPKQVEVTGEISFRKALEALDLTEGDDFHTVPPDAEEADFEEDN